MCARQGGPRFLASTYGRDPYSTAEARINPGGNKKSRTKSLLPPKTVDSPDVKNAASSTPLRLTRAQFKEQLDFFAAVHNLAAIKVSPGDDDKNINAGGGMHNADRKGLAGGVGVESGSAWASGVATPNLPQSSDPATHDSADVAESWLPAGVAIA
jgi:hypothetical protein